MEKNTHINAVFKDGVGLGPFRLQKSVGKLGYSYRSNMLLNWTIVLTAVYKHGKGGDLLAKRPTSLKYMAKPPV